MHGEVCWLQHFSKSNRKLSLTVSDTGLLCGPPCSCECYSFKILTLKWLHSYVYSGVNALCLCAVFTNYKLKSHVYTVSVVCIQCKLVHFVKFTGLCALYYSMCLIAYYVHGSMRD